MAFTTASATFGGKLSTPLGSKDPKCALHHCTGMGKMAIEHMLLPVRLFSWLGPEKVPLQRKSHPEIHVAQAGGLQLLVKAHPVVLFW